jgi:hemerythrin-like domain-containing protein
MTTTAPTCPTTAPPDLDGPADTRMMGIVHSALRRDLVRTRMVLEEEAPLDPARRTALADHVVWMMHVLHTHHHGEDIGLYPMVLRNNPGAAPLLAAMDADHARIDPAITALEAAAGALRADAAAAYAGVLAALTDLEAVLLPHLEREEQVMMPVVAECVTEREWQQWNQEVNVKPKPLMLLAEEAPWVLDNLDETGRALAVALVPPVPRFVLLRLLGGRYRRKHALLWRGRPAELVPSLSLDLVATWAR